MSRTQAAYKRGLDIGLSLILIIPASVLITLFWLLIKLSQPGAPAFFRQERVGQFGRTFVIYKLRTMRWPAEPFYPCIDEVRDRRITRLGRWLRRFKLDELPQLWQVLRGQMSLVGPRPLPLPEDVGNELRASVRPGLTGPAKLCGLYDSVKELPIDLAYIEAGFSVIRDIAILIKTIPFCCFGKRQRPSNSDQQERLKLGAQATKHPA